MAINWNVMEMDYNEDGLFELSNNDLNAFLNQWIADQEDAGDAAVFNKLFQEEYNNDF